VITITDIVINPRRKNGADSQFTGMRSPAPMTESSHPYYECFRPCARIGTLVLAVVRRFGRFSLGIGATRFHGFPYKSLVGAFRAAYMPDCRSGEGFRFSRS